MISHSSNPPLDNCHELKMMPWIFCDFAVFSCLIIHVVIAFMLSWTLVPEDQTLSSTGVKIKSAEALSDQQGVVTGHKLF